jgi:hypothetical protein
VVRTSSFSTQSTTNKISPGLAQAVREVASQYMRTYRSSTACIKQHSSGQQNAAATRYAGSRFASRLTDAANLGDHMPTLGEATSPRSSGFLTPRTNVRKAHWDDVIKSSPASRKSNEYVGKGPPQSNAEDQDSNGRAKPQNQSEDVSRGVPPGSSSPSQDRDRMLFSLLRRSSTRRSLSHMFGTAPARQAAPGQ